MAIISTLIFLALFHQAYGISLPKTFSELYHEHGLIVRGNVTSISQIPGKNLTEYNFRVLEFITQPQQSKFITAFSNYSTNNLISNQSQTAISVGNVVQLYLDNSANGYSISPYSFKLLGKCQNMHLGPNYLDLSQPPISHPATLWRFLDAQGNLVLEPVLNKEVFVKPDLFNDSPLEKRDMEISIVREGDSKPILQEIKQIDMQPCSPIDQEWKFIPDQSGNYSIVTKVMGGLYDNKIIVENSTSYIFDFLIPINSQDVKNSTNSILGTNLQSSVAPEFPLAIPILALGIVSPLILYRIKSKNKSFIS